MVSNTRSFRVNMRKSQDKHPSIARVRTAVNSGKIIECGVPSVALSSFKGFHNLIKYFHAHHSFPHQVCRPILFAWVFVEGELAAQYTNREWVSHPNPWQQTLPRYFHNVPHHMGWDGNALHRNGKGKSGISCQTLNRKGVHLRGRQYTLLVTQPPTAGFLSLGLVRRLWNVRQDPRKKARNVCPIEVDQIGRKGSIQHEAGVNKVTNEPGLHVSKNTPRRFHTTQRSPWIELDPRG